MKNFEEGIFPDCHIALEGLIKLSWELLDQKIDITKEEYEMNKL
jgi:hypothetical protein